MAALVIDAFEFCRRHEQREGSLPISELERLSQEVSDTAPVLSWKVQGKTEAREAPRLLLTIAGQVQLPCQRCLQPLEFSIDVVSTLVLARDDAEADQLEEMLEEEDVDVVVGAPSMDLIQLIEDDALLALPYAPRHATCPPHPEAVQVKNERLDSPFKVLERLKENPGGTT